jgi:hypothetical protein
VTENNNPSKGDTAKTAKSRMQFRNMNNTFRYKEDGPICGQYPLADFCRMDYQAPTVLNQPLP